MLKNYDELADVSEVYKFVVCLFGLVKVTCGKISKRQDMYDLIARCQMVFVFEDIGFNVNTPSPMSGGSTFKATRCSCPE